MKKVFLFLTMLLFAFVGTMRAAELTVYDGTTTNNYVPVYGLWADAYLRAQYVIPATDLAEDLQGGTITALRYALSTPAAAAWTGTFQVYLAEVPETTINAFISVSDATVVYQGTLDATGTTMTVTFDQGYVYQGGNLLIGFDQIVKGTYKSVAYKGTTVTGASVQGYNNGSVSAVSPTQRNFIPQTTFVFVPAPVACPKPQDFAVNYEGGVTAELSWTSDADLFNLMINDELVEGVTNPYVMEDLELATIYTVSVQADCGSEDGVSKWTAPITFNTDLCLEEDMCELTFELTDKYGDSWNGNAIRVTDALTGVIIADMANENLNGTSNSNEYELNIKKLAVCDGRAIQFSWVLGLYPSECSYVVKDVNNIVIFEGSGAMADTVDYTTSCAELGAYIVVSPNPMDLGYRPNNAWMEPAKLLLDNWGKPVTVSTMVCDNDYFQFDVETPFSMNHADSLYVDVTTGNGKAGEQNGSIFMVYNESRESNIITVTATAYDPVDGDVWEKAVEVEEFPFADTPAEIYKNYNIPGMSEDATDAVYKVTLENASLLNANVNGANAAVAIYTEDFNGENGPMVNNVYEGFNPGGNGGGNQGGTTFFDDFEDGNLTNWTTLDADGDGNTWQDATPAAYGIGDAYSGTHCASSWSWNNVSYDPDNWMISPMVEGATTLQYYVATNTGYPDHYGIYASTTGTNISDFTLVFQETAGAKGTPGVKSSMTKAGTRDMSAWIEKNIDLPAGTKYVAFRHWDSYDMNYLFIDDVTISSGAKSRALNGINDMFVAAGTYYIVAASTDEEFDVNISLSPLPAPEAAVIINPEDGATNVTTPATFSWELGAYTEEMQVLLGTLYPPTDVLVDWTGELINSYTVTSLEKNMIYFMQVNERNATGTTFGEIVGFTTEIKGVTGFAVDTTNLYPGESAVFTWDASRSIKGYNLYMDDVKVNETLITGTTYSVDSLEYNMEDGYKFELTAVYDEGESLPSAPIYVYMTGNGTVSGTVYEQDNTTPIAGVTVVFEGLDEFGALQHFMFTTNGEGVFTGDVYSGTYLTGASKTGYQDVLGPVAVVLYNEETDGIDFVMHEFYAPLGQIDAEEVEGGVDVTWSWTPANYVVDFEDGVFPEEFTLPASYPWAITTTNPHEGTYCMKSTCEGVSSGLSYVEATVDVPFDAKMGFWVRVSSENNYDKFHFYIDGVEKGSALSGTVAYTYKEYDVTAGTHTYKWAYQKDSSVNSGDDCAYIDDITMYRKDEPLPPTPGGQTYNFDDDTMMGWTSIDADNDGNGWVSSAEPGIYHNASVNLSGTGHNESEAYVISGSYANQTQAALTPDNYLVSPTPIVAQAGAAISFWACAQDASYPEEHFGVAVSTTTATASAFTTIQEWTMTAKGMGAMSAGRNRQARQGNWYQYTVDLSSYAGQTIYVAIRHFNCTDQFILNVDDITLGDGSVKGGDRSLASFNLYRRNNLVDETELIGTFNDTTFNYLDAEFETLPFGVYQWGIQAYYEGNATPQNREYDGLSEILWSNEIDKDMEAAVIVEVTLNNGQSAAGTQVVLDGDNHYTGVVDEEGVAIIDVRKGTYTLTIEIEGYTSIEETVVVNEDIVELEYTLNEIIAEVTNLYVSPTGYAMWDGNAPAPGPGPGPQGGTTYGFEASEEGWTSIDADGDGYEWYNLNPNNMTTQIPGHNGSAGHMTSASYQSVALTPDNYLVSPEKAAYTQISFWACGQDASWAAEHFGVAVSTTNNTSASAFTTIQEWTMTAKEGPKGARGMNAQGTWYEYTVDLSSYAGQDIWVAIRHFNCTDMFRINVDDVTLSTADKNDRAPRAYKVKLDGFPVGETTDNFYQFDVTGFEVGSTHVTSVAADYETGISEYVDYEWTYEGCEAYAGPTTFTAETNNGNVTLTWAFGGVTPPTPPTPPVGGTTYGFEASEEGWTSIDADGDGYEWYNLNPNNMTTQIPGHNGSAGHMTSASYQSVALTPDNYLVSPEKAAYTQISFWACGQDASWAAEHFGVAVSTTGNTSATDFTTIQEWTMTAKEGPKGARGMNEQGTWYEYTVDLNAYAGQDIWVAIRHFNVTDMFRINVDDVTLSTATKGNRDMWDYVTSFNGTSAGQQAVATDGNYIYTASWQSAPTGGHTFYQYTMDGTFVEGFDIAGATGIRDLTTDGEYFYGTSGASQLFILDFTTRTLVGTINCSGLTSRHISYDPERDGFWSGNWSTLALYSRTGALIQNGPAPTSAYGSAYYKDSDNVEHLFLFCQPNSDCKVYDYNITTGTLGSDVVLDYTSTAPGCTGIAGGCFIGEYNGNTCWYGNSQQDPNLIAIYELEAGTPGPGPGPQPGNILGVMIWRDGEPITMAPVSGSSFVDEGVENGEHEYCVRVVYSDYAMSCDECETVEVGGTVVCDPVTNLTAYYYDDATYGDGAMIEWVGNEDAVSYGVYVDGQYLGSTPEESVFIYGLTVGDTYTFGIVAEYANCESEMVTVQYTHTDGVEENMIVNAIYPNPTSGDLHIEATAMTQISIYNAMGQMVYSQDVNADEMVIDMSQFEAGVYMVNIITENGSAVKRITVVK